MTQDLEQKVEWLESELLRIRKLCEKAFQYQNTDPEVALSQARKSAEAICKNVYVLEGMDKGARGAEKMMLDELIQLFAQQRTLPISIVLPLRTIQAFGNFGSHDQGSESRSITGDYIRPCLEALNTVVDWYFSKYSPGANPELSSPGGRTASCNSSEKLFLELLEMAWADGHFEEGERAHLEKKRESLGLSRERAQELEEGVRRAMRPVPGIEGSAPGARGASSSRRESVRTEEDWAAVVGRRMVAIPAGRFLMGSERGAECERPVHEVRLGPFQMSKCLVTQKDYERVMGTNPSNFRGEPNRPVESVSWFDAVAFCNAWSELDGLEAVYAPSEEGVVCRFERNGYRLPTEAEWEYACRAGSSTEFFWGDDEASAGLYSWSDANSDDVTHAVGTRRKNAFGLYDLAGNVWEWTNDWFGEDAYATSDPEDPTGPEFGEFKVLRGGCWFNGTARLRSACRLRRSPGLIDDVTGFRCVARFRAR